jgi:hypothetical protein
MRALVLLEVVAAALLLLHPVHIAKAAARDSPPSQHFMFVSNLGEETS